MSRKRDQALELKETSALYLWVPVGQGGMSIEQLYSASTNGPRSGYGENHPLSTLVCVGIEQLYSMSRQIDKDQDMDKTIHSLPWCV